MKLLPSLFAFGILLRTMFAGESVLMPTFQPLSGLGSGTIKIVEVTCHQWYGGGGGPIRLISARNVPPTDNPTEATEDLNLASVCGVLFLTGDIGNPNATPELTLDATRFVLPERLGYPREHIVRACLECLRRCLEKKLLKTSVTLQCADADKNWLTKIVTDFNAHDRTKVFFTPPS